MTRSRRLLKWLMRVCLLLMLVVGGPVAWFTWLGNLQPVAAADCIVVPGARTDADGHLGLCLTARTQHAIELYRTGLAPNIIFTGGRGVEGSVESECARVYAGLAGVPSDHMFCDVLSHDTDGNFRQTAHIMQQHHWTRCLIATDPFHARRCLRIALDYGLTATVSPAWQSPAWKQPGMLAYYTTREYAAWVKYALRHLGLYPASEDHA